MYLSEIFSTSFSPSIWFFSLRFTPHNFSVHFFLAISPIFLFFAFFVYFFLSYALYFPYFYTYFFSFLSLCFSLAIPSPFSPCIFFLLFLSSFSQLFLPFFTLFFISNLLLPFLLSHFPLSFPFISLRNSKFPFSYSSAPPHISFFPDLFPWQF